ncbi:hypothetical protein [Paenibacillus sp. NEAU-GSW1]|uniref:hypothetical protein n=1 Tax=Paenibacillus sp. NEAU-GSW1 TaxID=2682486 RepID=UPI0012E144B3|nr:hypothetical protein [Paenibacillus sp. NEAU-GSW1]MUT68427.1 hypothetical protein [Paenibacillus sp. NEAU-GSW1]
MQVIFSSIVRRTAFGLKGLLSADTEQIGNMLRRVLELEGWGESLINLYIIQSLAEGYYEWDRRDECRSLLFLVDHAAITHTTPIARICLAEGHISAARAEAAKLGITIQDRPTFDRYYEYMTLVRLLYAMRKDSEALRLLELMQPQAMRENCLSSQMEILVLQACLMYRYNNRALAMRRLRRLLPDEGACRPADDAAAAGAGMMRANHKESAKPINGLRSLC